MAIVLFQIFHNLCTFGLQGQLLSLQVLLLEVFSCTRISEITQAHHDGQMESLWERSNRSGQVLCNTAQRGALYCSAFMPLSG